MKSVLSCLLCLLVLNVIAQEKLVVKGKAPNQYVVYTVANETTLQQVSNRFGQSATRLASYNGIDAKKKLTKGAAIKIPITTNNIVHTRSNNSNAPVYYTVAKGDNLYKLSKENKVPLATLKQWNNLKSDVVKVGDLLMIGYMVNAKADVAEVAPVNDNAPTALQDIPRVNVPETKPTTKVAPPQEMPVVAAQPAPQVAQAQTTTPVVANTQGAASDYTPKDGDEGYFAAAYTQQASGQAKQFQSGDAGTFKTISGWSDRKYYVLMNDVAPETIVRITTSNNKSICAKVLGPLQETKGGTNLLLRMSNSAASVLGMTDAKFTVTVTYFE